VTTPARLPHATPSSAQADPTPRPTVTQTANPASTRPSPQTLVEGAKKHPILGEVYRVVSIMVAAVIFAVGLEGFLIPNGFMDGGTVGISILLTKFFDVPMGVFIGVLNVPFLILAWTMIGRRAAIRSGIGIATLSASTIYLHHIHMAAFTDESWLALVCGGAMIAVGIGLALRHGGAFDGAEVLATVLATRTNATVGQVILYINLGIFGAAGFVLGWEAALLSTVLFYVVVKNLVDQIAHGEHGTRQAHVSTARYEEVAPLISARINRPVLVDIRTRWYADGRGAEVGVINFPCSRMEEATLVEDIEAIDPWANISFTDIGNHHGPMFESIKGASH
jgi:uncharacterized membrane-anchored protein YitT (DUF2179 family)